MSPEQIKHMVARFLQWKLPESFNPDGGISFERICNAGTPFASSREPVGTNLLDATQAEAMVRHMIDGLPRNGARTTIVARVDASEALAQIETARAKAEARVAELEALINSPETDDWLKGVQIEAAHQIERWGVEHDAGKSAWDWFWLIGYLSQKAAAAQVAGDAFKAKHHTISTAAALLNWHRHLSGADQRMRPGIDPVARGVA